MDKYQALAAPRMGGTFVTQIPTNGKAVNIMSTIEDDARQNASRNSPSGANTSISTLHDVLAARALQFGDRRAYTFQGKRGDEVVTFAQLDCRARAIAAELQQHVKPGDRVLLLFHAGLDFIASFFGCLHAGVLAVPTTYPKPRRPMPRLTSIARDCDAAAVLTDSETLPTLDQSITNSSTAHMRWIAVDQIDERRADDFQQLNVAADQLAFLQYTSGSTSEPKGVMVSHGNLLHNLEMIRQGFGLRAAEEGGDDQTGVFWLPAYHDMGLIGGILETLYIGGHSVLMSPAAFLQRPIGWLEAISEYSAAISGAPNFAYELAASRSSLEQRRQLDLTHWRLAFCGAEPIRPETLQSFAETFGVSGFREESFYPCFGLAEGTLHAAGGNGPHELVIKNVDRQALAEHQVKIAKTATDDTQALVGCGNALHGQEIAIVHVWDGSDGESLTACQPGQVGEIWLKGPSVARGYWGQDEESERTFRATLAESGSGPYLRTGDLGFMADGNLFVTGRLKDVMIIRGRNHYPQDVEKTAGAAHEALRQDSGAVFTVDIDDGQEQVVIVHEIDRQFRKADFDEVIRHIRRAVAEVHELEIYAVVLIRHARLPRTTSGKAQRHVCREQFETGEFKALAEWKRQPKTKTASGTNGKPAKSPNRLLRDAPPMTPDEIDRLGERVERWLLNWLVERAAIPPAEVHRDKPFAEYGLDSLTAVELSQELEDWLGVEVVPTVAWNYPTPATLAIYLSRAAGGADQEADFESNAEAGEVDDEFSRLLAEIESMSDQDATSRLDDDEG